MRITNPDRLYRFLKRHTNAKQQLEFWYDRVCSEDWETPERVTQLHPARIIPPNRVVFNVKGNSYRLVAVINYKRRLVDIRFIGTHAEYDRIDVKEI